MERPYVICHMLTSLDGKIDGDYMSAPECAPALQAYANLRAEFGCEATLYGTNTMAGGYADGIAPPLPPVEGDFQTLRQDTIAPHDAENYIISLDPQGVLAFSSPYSARKGRPRAHIVEVLTQQATDPYLAYLRGTGVSYIFAGTQTIDCALLLRKLQSLLGIRRLLVAGGGITNWSFAAAHLLDEVSVVIAPVADGRTDTVSIFERRSGAPNTAPVSFALQSAVPLEGGAVWLRYRRRAV